MLRRLSTRHRNEILAQLSLALPIVGGQLAQTANGFVDAVMAGRVGPEDLAAVSVGASIWVPVFLFITGVLMSTTAILSRHLGAGAYHRINPLAQQALWLAIALGLLGALLLRAMAPVLVWMEVDPAIRPMVRGYLNAVSWGMPAIAVFLALRGYTEAIRHTRPVLLISVIGLLINIPANYILIHGKFGMPALGGIGCGVATSIVMWTMAALMALYVRSHPAYHRARPDLRTIHFEPGQLLYMIRLGVPVGLAIFFEVSIFAAIALLISKLGATIVAGHQIALNFTSLIFMVPLSLSLAVTVRVGHARGRENPQAVQLTCNTALWMSSLVGLLGALMLLLFRHHIPAIYTTDQTVREIASSLLLFAALYQLSDAWQVIANGALRGFEDTRVPMFITLVAYWGIGLPTGYILGRTDLVRDAMGPEGFWIGLIAGLTAAAVALGLRLHRRLARESGGQGQEASVR